MRGIIFKFNINKMQNNSQSINLLNIYNILQVKKQADEYNIGEKYSHYSLFIHTCFHPYMLSPVHPSVYNYIIYSSTSSHLRKKLFHAIL